MGVVALNPVRLDAIEIYLEAADAPEGVNVRLKWAERQMKVKDEFLQTSAVFEIERQSDVQRALKSLSSVVRSNDSTLLARKLAVQVIGDLPGAAAATTFLQQTAENRRIPEVIRRDAVLAVSDRPDAKDILEKWAAGKDSLLSSEASKVITTKQKQP
jgi:hypothetical protein